MKVIDYYDYWKEVREQALCAVKDRVSLYEIVENHLWLTYNCYYYDVLRFTDNEDKIIELGISLDEVVKKESWHGVLRAVAWWSFYGDIEDYLYNEGYELNDNDIFFKKRDYIKIENRLYRNLDTKVIKLKAINHDKYRHSKNTHHRRDKSN